MQESVKNLRSTLSKKVVINLFVKHNYAKTSLLDVLKPEGLSLEQYNVLRILRGQKGGPLNLQDIQERMINKMSNTTRLIDKLILKQFAKRKECPENRRKIEVYITEKGLEQLQALDPIFEKAEQGITSNLNDKELLQLNQLLTKIGA